MHTDARYASIRTHTEWLTKRRTRTKLAIVALFTHEYSRKRQTNSLSYFFFFFLHFSSSLFDAHPEYQIYFESFKDVPRAELPQNKKLQAHGVNVVKALSEVVQGLTDTDRLVPHLEGLGSRHYKRGQREEHFNVSSLLSFPFSLQKWDIHGSRELLENEKKKNEKKYHKRIVDVDH